MEIEKHPSVQEAEGVIRDAAKRRTARRKRNGLIVAGSLALSLITGSTVWGQPSHQASACQPVFAGRTGMIPCSTHVNTPTDDKIEQIIGTTTTGCVLGLIFGGPPGFFAGCVGGAAGNIVW